jgi:peptide/nickel transport system substrate-binding protein
MVLALDLKAFNDILFQGNALDGATMLPPPAGFWGMPKEKLPDLLGHAPDREKSLAEARELMKKAGYGPDKPLRIKVATRNIATYRDPAVILIDQLKRIYIEGELETIDTTVWHAKMTRGDYQVGMNQTGGRHRRSRRELLRELPFGNRIATTAATRTPRSTS